MSIGTARINEDLDRIIRENLVPTITVLNISIKELSSDLNLTGKYLPNPNALHFVNRYSHTQQPSISIKNEAEEIVHT